MSDYHCSLEGCHTSSAQQRGLSSGPAKDLRNKQPYVTADLILLSLNKCLLKPNSRERDCSDFKSLIFGNSEPYV